MRFAVFDLGSTSFQLLVADADDEGNLVRVLRDRVILNLGMSLANGGRIPARHATQAAETVRRFRDLAARAGADVVLPIATSALRDATNRDDLEGRLSSAAGASIRFLDGEEEGLLTVLGVRGCVAVGSSSFLVVDLGGGSCEIAVASADGVRWAESFPLGAGRLTSQVLRHDPATREEWRTLRSLVRSTVRGVRERLAEDAPQLAIVSGGTPGAVARLLAVERWGFVPSSLNQMELPASDLRSIARRLATATLERRLRLTGVDERRAHVLPAGAIVLATLAEELDVSSFVLSDWGLREGVILEAVGAVSGTVTAHDLRAHSVDNVARTWRTDRSHPMHVAGLAQELFDELAPLHRLEPLNRELLGYAALLHDIGVRVSPERHHKHSAYLVEHAGLRGFDPVEVAYLCSIVRFQKSGGPSTSYPPFGLLPIEARQRCIALTGLLRVAHALGRGSERDVSSMTVRQTGGAIAIAVSGSGNPAGAAADAQERSELLARALDLPIEITVGGSAAMRA
ncbi:MAG: Ppx/GppA phosphatase family protein [Actinomycetota bacterium]